MLSDIENDALTVPVNIAVSGAAIRLRAMVGAEVLLTVPAVSVVDGANALRTLDALGLTSLMAVRQSFSGRLFGETMLVFPEENHGELVRAVLGDDMSVREVQALTADALGEIGNVLLLGFLSTIDAMLDLHFEVSLPTVALAKPEDIFVGDADQVALLIYVNFSISGRDVCGYFGLVIGLATFVILQKIRGVHREADLTRRVGRCPHVASIAVAARKGVTQANEFNALACLTPAGRGFVFIGEFGAPSNLSSLLREA